MTFTRQNKIKVLIIATVIAYSGFGLAIATNDPPKTFTKPTTVVTKPVAKPPVTPQPAPPEQTSSPKDTKPAVTRPTPAPVATPANSCSTPDNEVEALVNNYRASHGIKRLCADQRLRNAAYAHAQYLCQRNSVEAFHAHENYPAYAVQAGFSAPVGENLVAGFNNASESVNAWINSPSHNANMLDPDYTVQGISVFNCPPNFYNLTAEYLGIL